MSPGASGRSTRRWSEAPSADGFIRRLSRHDLLYLGYLALDQALDRVDEVELGERAPLAGPDHLDANRAALLVAGDDPGVPPVGAHSRAHLVQRLLDPALHVALRGHPQTDYTSIRGGLRAGQGSRMNRA